MKKLFTILIVMFPVLSVYSTPIYRVSVADFFLLVIGIFIIIDFFYRRKKIYKRDMPIIVLMIYIFFTFILQFYSNTGVEIFSTLRYILYILILIIGRDYFNFNYGIKLLKYTTLTISVYVILQFLVFKLFNVTLPSFISLFPIMDNNFLEIQNSSYYLEFYRPTGIFLEPSHFAQFCVVYLIYLTNSNVEKRKYTQIIIIIFAILCSGSSIGFIVLILIFGMNFMKYFIRGISLKKFLISIIAILIVGIIIYKVPYFSKIITRMQSETGEFNGAAVQYRFKSLELLLNDGRDFSYKLIGLGRGSENVYYTGIFYILNAHGIIGVGLYVLMALFAWVKNIKFNSDLILVVFILSIGSEYIVNFGILFYMMFLIKQPIEKLKVE